MDEQLKLPSLNKQELGDQVRNYLRNYHAYPYTGSALFGAGAALPTYALSKMMGLGSLPTTALTGLAGLTGAVYGYNK